MVVPNRDRLDLNPTFSLFANMPTPAATLRASLEKHNDTFESLLKLIPPKYYIVEDHTVEQVRALRSRLFGSIFFLYSLYTDVKISET